MSWHNQGIIQMWEQDNYLLESKFQDVKLKAKAKYYVCEISLAGIKFKN